MKRLKGKIVFVDDEKIEKELLFTALKELDIDAELVYFKDGEEAFHYIKNTQDSIFIIISDMNMPKMNGMELKKAIDSDKGLREKSIPFIFSSSVISKAQLREAYDYRLQGYFFKPDEIAELIKQLEVIFNYWIISARPDSDLASKQGPILKM